MKKQNSYSFI